MVQTTYIPEKTISAIFTEEKQINNVIERLLDRGIDREHISVMGKNFESQTRITQFIDWSRSIVYSFCRLGCSRRSS